MSLATFHVSPEQFHADLQYIFPDFGMRLHIMKIEGLYYDTLIRPPQSRTCRPIDLTKTGPRCGPMSSEEEVIMYICTKVHREACRRRAMAT